MIWLSILQSLKRCSQRNCWIFQAILCHYNPMNRLCLN
jgi:hypothetical protein